MTRSTAYLQRHPSGIYYFRIAIPQALKSLLSQRELKTSLRTRDPVIAQRTAQVLALEAEHLFNRIENHCMPKDPKIEIGLTIGRFYKQPDGTIEMEGVELDPDKADEELRLFKGLTQSPPEGTPTIKAKDSSTLEEVIVQYCEEKTREGSWTAKSEQENRAIYTLLVRILGNIPIADINAAKARDYKHVLMKLPPNINKSPLYRSKTLQQILDMAPKAMSTTTVNKNMNGTRLSPQSLRMAV